MEIIDLNGAWRCKAINRYGTLPASARKSLQWMTAEVPGTIHTDLIANKIIPDPSYRMNELDVQWIDSQQWVYRRTVQIPEDFLNEHAVVLSAEGLDTYATITINGEKIGETANMFIAHEFDVKKILRRGTNEIKILFDSPVVRSQSLEKKNGKLLVSSESHRVYVRKAQYSFGWDWGPKLTTSGIWRNISLRAYSVGRLKHPFVKVNSVTARAAVLDVSVEIEQSSDSPMTLRTYIGGETSSIEREIRAAPGTVRFQIHIPNPKLWWPRGYGAQPLYTAVFMLMCGGKEIHHIEMQFAIRTVKLIQAKDREGTSFILAVNGVKIFCKGVDWIPSDSFIPRIPDSTYATLLNLAKDAYVNIVRVWGGGIYEQDIFYDLCDQLGLMVWQDFMYACGEYPEQRGFLNAAQAEAESVVRHLRNHPSIVLWCGNNECEWQFCTQNPDKTPDDMSGAPIFREILPSVCKSLDGTRPYWRSSPFGKGFPNAESNGNHHQWVVWSFWKDYKEYANDNARFVTEFGFQAPANRSTFDAVTLLEDRDPQSPVMEHHNKQTEGTERLMRFQAAHYRLGSSYAEFIYKGQLVQAEALKFAVEHWRRRKFSTAGAIYWQFNDCWPASSWATVDSALKPKAGYYFTKKFFAPILASFKETAGGIEAWIVNDRFDALEGTLVISLRSFLGKKLWAKRKTISIPANCSIKGERIADGFLAKCDKTSHYLHMELQIANAVVSENRFFFAEPKHLQLPDVTLRTRLTEVKNRGFVLSVSSKSFVKNLQIDIDNETVVFDDNYFDLDAGTTKRVGFISSLPKKTLLKNLRLRWV